MKLFFVCLLAIIHSGNAFASDFFISCGNSVSAMKAWSEGDKVYLRLDDQIGFKNFPIYDGVVTPSMAPLVLRGVEELKAFDHYMLLSWDKLMCRFDPKRPFLIDCAGRAQIEAPANVKNLTSPGMSIVLERQEHLDMNVESVKFHLGFDTTGIDYVHYFLAFPFDRRYCLAEYPEKK